MENITYYKAATEWWIDKITSNCGRKFDNGDKVYGGVAMLLAMMVNSSTEITEDSIETFRVEMENVIKEKIEEEGRCLLMSDYSPEGTLDTIVRKSGIPEARIPWKTIMYIEPSKVEVALGYGESPVTIFEE